MFHDKTCVAFFLSLPGGITFHRKYCIYTLPHPSYSLQRKKGSNFIISENYCVVESAISMLNVIDNKKFEGVLDSRAMSNPQWKYVINFIARKFGQYLYY